MASVSLYQLLGYSEKPLTLQMFIGTADERNLRPHAFYQVHRITGKMVATASYEAVVTLCQYLTGVNFLMYEQYMKIQITTESQPKAD